MGFNDSRIFDKLFHFFLSKWHSMHMADFAKRLSKIETITEQTKEGARTTRYTLNKSDKRALRDKLRDRKGPSVETAPPGPTPEQLARRVDLAKQIGSQTFSNRSKTDLQACMKECGGVVKPACSFIDLRSVLRGIAPAIGIDVEPESEEGEFGLDF